MHEFLVPEILNPGKKEIGYCMLLSAADRSGEETAV